MHTCGCVSVSRVAGSDGLPVAMSDELLASDSGLVKSFLLCVDAYWDLGGVSRVGLGGYGHGTWATGGYIGANRIR